MRSLAIACLSWLVIGAAAAKAEDANIRIPETEIILAVQAAVRADDRHWFAEQLHLPVRYYRRTNQTIRSKDWFLRHYATVIGPELKASILAQDPENYLKNYQGTHGRRRQPQYLSRGFRRSRRGRSVALSNHHHQQIASRSIRE
jgi:hypothetical protein